MTDYLTPDDPEAFLDYPKRPIPEGQTECPRCKGRGGWNLLVHRYPLREDAPAGHAHFRTLCGACWGWGYLQPGQTCAHEWKDHQTVGNCLHEWICIHCGEKRVVDSSD